MKVQHLGKLTELPSVPDEEFTHLLIIQDKDGNSVFTDQKGYQDFTYWLDYEKQSKVDSDDLLESYPEGFEAVLITFDPDDNKKTIPRPGVDTLATTWL
jgi:hypothetical protein